MMRTAFIALCVAASTAIAEHLPPSPPGANLAAELMATSNLWGVAKSQYEGSVRTLLASMTGDAQCEDSIIAWFSSVALYEEIPTGCTTCVWFYEKSRMLDLYSRMPCVSASTNAWLASAGWLGRLRQMDAEASDEHGALTIAGIDTKSPEAINAMLRSQAENRRKAWNIKTGRDDALGIAWNLVTNRFPAAVLPSLTDPERSVVVSNICEKAAIDAASFPSP